jgi:hypothetical protein
MSSNSINFIGDIKLRLRSSYSAAVPSPAESESVIVPAGDGAGGTEFAH